MGEILQKMEPCGDGDECLVFIRHVHVGVAGVGLGNDFFTGGFREAL
jgi:hypothetical protein